TANYIGKAIHSALNQTLEKIEVIVVDDASQDNSIEIVQQINDVRLKLLINEKNLGAGGARNRALNAAQGEWVAVLDSDDWYDPMRLERLVRVATEKNADIVADDLYLIEDGKSEPWGTLIGENQESINSIQKIEAVDFINSDIPDKQGLCLGFSKPLFKRDFLVNHQIQYDETIKVTQDFWFDMDCFAHKASYYLIPEPYYYYRARENSLICSDKIKRLEDECRAITNFYSYKDYLNDNPDVLAALQEKESATHKLLRYYRIVEPLKKGDILKSLAAINFDFQFWKFMIPKIPASIQRRLESMFSQPETNIQKLTFKKQK
ncbi:MAG: glycosyltransferase family 2 protein, partial [Xenococcus sp. (in: cyanobacteria)]